jgi:hypothetical protein
MPLIGRVRIYHQRASCDELRQRLEMTNHALLLESVRDVLRVDTRIGFDKRPIALALSNGDLVM